MKKILILGAFMLFGFFSQVSMVYAVHVNGYYRSNGTYVNSYERTAPDSSPYNNYSYPGNYNPNTGSITGGNASTYLNNYYNSSSYSSGYSAPSSYSSYTATPSCPLNSYSSGSSCKCNYGYVVSGGSCVSADSLCWDSAGYGSSYDSLSGNCKCKSGYVIGTSGKCEIASLVCSAKIGLMSQYNSISGNCECMSGYEFDGSTCIYKKPSYSYPTTYSQSSSCPVNSHVSTVDSTKCFCDTGYKGNLTNDGCVYDITSTIVQAVTSSSQSTTTPSYLFTKELSSGSTGADVVALQTFLIGRGLLTLPTGVSVGSFGRLTMTSVKAYQAIKGIRITGQVGPLTITALNADLNNK
jgi:hypothetical protein